MGRLPPENVVVGFSDSVNPHVGRFAGIHIVLMSVLYVPCDTLFCLESLYLSVAVFFDNCNISISSQLISFTCCSRTVEMWLLVDVLYLYSWSVYCGVHALRLYIISTSEEWYMWLHRLRLQQVRLDRGIVYSWSQDERISVDRSPTSQWPKRCITTEKMFESGRLTLQARETRNSKVQTKLRWIPRATSIAMLAFDEPELRRSMLRGN